MPRNIISIGFGDEDYQDRVFEAAQQLQRLRTQQGRADQPMTPQDLSALRGLLGGNGERGGGLLAQLLGGFFDK